MMLLAAGVRGPERRSGSFDAADAAMSACCEVEVADQPSTGDRRDRAASSERAFLLQ
jgi:hypothetical protein